MLAFRVLGVVALLVAACQAAQDQDTAAQDPKVLSMPLYPRYIHMEKRYNHRTGTMVLADVDASLWGSIGFLGRFFAQIWVDGAPYRVQIDTGSSTLGLFSSTCDNCLPHVDLPYNSTNKVPCSDLSCDQCAPEGGCFFQLTYGDRSGIKGHLTYATVALGRSDGPSATQVAVGAVTHVTPTFQGFALDGIMGVMYSTGNCLPSCYPTFINNLATQNSISAQIYGMCLGAQGGGGVWDVGAVVTSRYSGTMQYTPIQRTQGVYEFFAVDIQGFTIGGVSQGIPTQTIVDSGTTLFLMPAAQYSSFQSQISGAAHASILQTGQCATMSDSDLATWPDITLTFAGETPGSSFTLTIEASTYLFVQFLNFRCLGIRSSGGVGQSLMILGDVFMQKYYTVFDMVNNRVGFANVSNCPDPGPCPTGTYNQSNMCVAGGGVQPGGGGGDDDSTGLIVFLVILVLAVLIGVSIALFFMCKKSTPPPVPYMQAGAYQSLPGAHQGGVVQPIYQPYPYQQNVPPGTYASMPPQQQQRQPLQQPQGPQQPQDAPQPII